jgi:hypothetical protein
MDWIEKSIVSNEDVTEMVRAMKAALDKKLERREQELIRSNLMPQERSFEVPDSLRRTLGMDMKHCFDSIRKLLVKVFLQNWLRTYLTYKLYILSLATKRRTYWKQVMQAYGISNIMDASIHKTELFQL